MTDDNEGFAIHVDQNQPSTLTFADTDGEPILAYDPDNGWLLNVQYYYPFVMQVNEFDATSEALTKARELLAEPLPEACRVFYGRVNLLREWGEPGETSYFLDAHFELNGTLTISGQNLGRNVGRDGEYEYWYGIKAEHLPALLAALGGTPDQNILAFLEQHWSGDAAKELETAIRNSGVEYRFFNYF